MFLGLLHAEARHRWTAMDALDGMTHLAQQLQGQLARAAAPISDVDGDVKATDTSDKGGDSDADVDMTSS